MSRSRYAFSKCGLHKGLPFPVKIPIAKIRETFEKTHRGEDFKTYNRIEEKTEELIDRDLLKKAREEVRKKGTIPREKAIRGREESSMPKRCHNRLTVTEPQEE